uniref:BTB domain-containing protein n=1 Tax=Panagrolaimus superbus TaxID=310955 RepID=A0A914Z723_9BILA
MSFPDSDCYEWEKPKSDYLHKMQTERFKVFQQQDLENGRFDVTFEIDGKKLLAHTFILTSVSETLNSWLSDRWTTKDAIIKIEDSSYDNFYEFLCFLYIGDCKLTEENVFEMVDMAEFYGVPCLKEFCDNFLSKMEKQVETIEEMFEFADKYYLKELKESIKRCFCTYVVEVCESEAFIAFKKPFVEFLYAASLRIREKEIGFEYVSYL